ncbi:MAG: quinolinate synthase NadA [Candidatus Pacebacteria bacterium]|nr:quinolinate synthase NadA [Candidatus Paceibacterota bacterium]
MATIHDTIKELKKQRNAVILSHTYQPAEVQDVADFVGDSYGLSKTAAGVDADMIVFCGVRFMAETAAVLNPDRKVVMPDKKAGCPMADMLTADQLRELKKDHPGAPVVCYVNSSAEVKAESTVCCTSSNAVKIVASLGDAEDIIFVPDRYLGRFVERNLHRELILWDGYCPTHALISADSVKRMREQHPDAEVMVHPECTPEVQDQADHVLSTGQMCDLVKTTACRTFIVGTEKGIIHTLRKLAPHIEFVLLSPSLICPNMKRTTLAKIARALETGETQVNIPPPIADKARTAINAMLEITEASPNA